MKSARVSFSGLSGSFWLSLLVSPSLTFLSQAFYSNPPPPASLLPYPNFSLFYFFLLLCPILNPGVGEVPPSGDEDLTRTYH